MGEGIGLVVDEDGLDALRTFHVDAEGLVDGEEDEGVEEEAAHRTVDGGGVGRGRGTEQGEEGDGEEGEGGEVQGSLRLAHPHVVAIEAIPPPPDRDEAVQGRVEAVPEHPGIDHAAGGSEGDTGDACSEAGIPIQSPDPVQPVEEDGTGGQDGVEFPARGWEPEEEVVAVEDAPEGEVVPDREDGEEGGVDPGTGHELVQIVYPLPLLEGQQEGVQRAEVDRGHGDGEQVIRDPGQLVEQGPGGG